MHRSLFAVASVCAVFGAGALAQEKLPFHDPAYFDASWKYLEEKYPDLVRQWDSLPVEQQVEAITRVGDKGLERAKEVYKGTCELTNLCGPAQCSYSGQWWNLYEIVPKPRPSCDLKAVSEITDEQIATAELWSVDPQGHKDTRVREMRRHALQLMVDIDSGHLSEADIQWAEANIDPMQAAALENAKKASLHSIDDKAVMGGVQSLLPQGFDPQKAAGMLQASAGGASAANTVFDGSVAGAPGVQLDISARLDDLAFRGEEERVFSQDWNKAVAGRLSGYNDPVSKEILAGTGGRLPTVVIRPLDREVEGANYEMGGNLITLNGTRVANSITYAIGQDPSLSTPSCTEALANQDRSSGLADCLHSSPRLMSAVLDDFEPANIHELEHAVQDRRFGFNQALAAPQAQPPYQSKQIEKEAFIKELTWMSYHSDSKAFSSNSPEAQFARYDYRAYFTDSDAFMRDVDSRYGAVPDLAMVRRMQELHLAAAGQVAGTAADLSEMNLARVAAQGQPISKMEAYYASYFPGAEQEWRSRSPGALLTLAARDRDPVESLEALAAARPRLAAGSKEAQWADMEIVESKRRAIAALSQLPSRDPRGFHFDNPFSGPPPTLDNQQAFRVGQQVRRLEGTLTAVGQPFPPELKVLRKSTCERSVENILDLLDHGKLAGLQRDYLIAEGLDFSRLLGDSSSTKRLLEYQRHPPGGGP